MKIDKFPIQRFSTCLVWFWFLFVMLYFGFSFYFLCSSSLKISVLDETYFDVVSCHGFSTEEKKSSSHRCCALCNLPHYPNIFLLSPMFSTFLLTRMLFFSRTMIVISVESQLATVARQNIHGRNCAFRVLHVVSGAGKISVLVFFFVWNMHFK